MQQDMKEQRMLSFVQENSERGNPQSVVDTIDKFCRDVDWAMNVGDEKGLIVDEVVKERDPSVILELGTYCGYSATRIARLLRPEARLFSIELNPVHAAVAKQMVAFAGLQNQVKVLEGDTGAIIPQLKEKYNVDTVDFVFLDHAKEQYTPDTKLLEECRLLKEGFVLLADNVVYPGNPEFSPSPMTAPPERGYPPTKDRNLLNKKAVPLLRISFWFLSLMGASPGGTSRTWIMDGAAWRPWKQQMVPVPSPSGCCPGLRVGRRCCFPLDASPRAPGPAAGSAPRKDELSAPAGRSSGLRTWGSRRTL